MRKRQKFVLVTFLMSVGLWWVQQANLEWRYLLICLLGFVNWIFSSWALRESLSGVEWLTVTLPISTFTMAVGFFYILLPEHWLAKIAVVGLYAVGQYALLLTANIFSVASIRTIALFRAAQAVGLVVTLLTGFFLYNTILSLRLGWWAVGGLVFVASFLLLLPDLWAVKLEPKLNMRVVLFSLVSAILLGVLGMSTTIWPMSLAVSSVFLTSFLYVYSGIIQHYFSERLFKNIALEYITVGGTVLLIVLWITSFSQG